MRGRVEARAGSGKTLTLMGVIKSVLAAHPDHAILYTVFNSKNAADAQQRIAALGLTNATAMCVHAWLRGAPAWLHEGGRKGIVATCVRFGLRSHARLPALIKSGSAGGCTILISEARGVV